jgi:hypothetical protein
MTIDLNIYNNIAHKILESIKSFRVKNEAKNTYIYFMIPTDRKNFRYLSNKWIYLNHSF